MRKRLLRTAAVFLFTILLAVNSFLIFFTDPVPLQQGSGKSDARSEETQEAIAEPQIDENETVHVTILGDSIAKGYSREKTEEITPYGDLVIEYLAAENGFEYEIDNYARNGLDTVKMNASVLTEPEVSESLRVSDYIFLTAGSNDLLNTCKKEAQAVLERDTKFRSVGDAMDILAESVTENPLLILRIIDAIQNWDYDAFEEQWVMMMDTIRDSRKQDSIMAVTNIYNPVSNLELPSVMNQVVENVIINMNEIIEAHADEYQYQVIDLFHSDICEYVQSDGVHPTQEGQQLIADIMTGKNESSGQQYENTAGRCLFKRDYLNAVFICRAF